MLIPNKIDPKSSPGEKAIFHRFQIDPRFDECFILHSVFLNNHIKNLSGEIDFLLVVPNKGIFVLEVKHGGVRRINGEWIYTNSKNESNKTNKSPFTQANNALHSLRKWILKNCHQSFQTDLEKLMFGTGVIFSSVETQVDIGTEGEQWQVLYKEGITKNYLSDYVIGLSTGWYNKYSNQVWFDKNKYAPNQKQCEYLVKLIRGDFNHDYSILNQMNDTSNEIEHFTNEQLKKYSHIKRNKRNLIVGSASTGKTVLAFQLAIEMLNNGVTIGFICFNKLLAQKIKSSFTNYDKVPNFFGSFHSLLAANTKESGSENTDDFYSDELPISFVIENEDFEKFDYLIIDEAQDIISENNLFALDHLIMGGLEGGQYSFFGDFEEQNIYQDKNNLDLLEKYNLVNYDPLTINCRNSNKIAALNTMLTKIEYSQTLNDSLSKPVTTKFTPKNKITSIITETLTKLKNENIPEEYVTILSANRATLEELKSSIPKTVNYEVTFETIHSYKGLENEYIILTGFNDLLSDKSKSLLYIGISRAKYKLFIILSKDLESDYSKLITPS